MPANLTNRRVLVTAGPTWVPVDAIRYLTNFASGSLGLFLAREAAAAGAQVRLLLGPGRICPTEEDRRRLEIVDFTTFDDLHRLVRRSLGEDRFDALLHTAAVADYRPAEVRPVKTPSGASEWLLRLVPLPKIVDEVKALAPQILLVKFKLEVGRSHDELLRIAAASRARSDADLIVANDRARFAAKRHPAVLMDAGGVLVETETREELAEALLEVVGRRLAATAAGSNPAKKDPDG